MLNRRRFLVALAAIPGLGRLIAAPAPEPAPVLWHIGSWKPVVRMSPSPPMTVTFPLTPGTRYSILYINGKAHSLHELGKDPVLL